MVTPNINGYELVKSLDFPAYSISETSRLAGIPPWSVSRYLRGYEYKYLTRDEMFEVHKPPIVSQSLEKSTYASFLDLIDLLFVKEFLKRDFTLQFLRHALLEAKERLGTPHFARSVFYTSGNEIVLRLPKDGYLIALMTGGQIALPKIIEELSKILDFENITEFGFARRWYPRGRDGLIVIDPQIAFGRPTLIGHGVATGNIYDLYLGEKEKYLPVSEWFNIPIPKIKTAVQFEHSLCA